MKPLDQPIRLRVVGGGRDVGDGQKAAEGGPKRGGELGTSVTGDGGRDPKPLDPAMQKGRCAVCGGDGGQRECLRPAGGPVDHSEQVHR